MGSVSADVSVVFWHLWDLMDALGLLGGLRYMCSSYAEMCLFRVQRKDQADI